jgi:ATP-binding cassette, subfamily C (CFTR/MRP), member 4
MLLGSEEFLKLRNQLKSLRGVCEIRNIPIEAPLCTANKNRPKHDWPQFTKVSFENVFMKLTPDGNYILKDLTFKINAGERCGILSIDKGDGNLIIAALLRLAINSGLIEIDDINIESIGLHDLRRAFTIIPSKGVLFSGTVRSNLDPFEEKTDDVIWESLDHVKLKHFISKLPDRLDTPIESKFLKAVERRQVEFARALLRRSRMLIVEENVDENEAALR